MPYFLWRIPSVSDLLALCIISLLFFTRDLLLGGGGAELQPGLPAEGVVSAASANAAQVALTNATASLPAMEMLRRQTTAAWNLG